MHLSEIYIHISDTLAIQTSEKRSVSRIEIYL